MLFVNCKDVGIIDFLPKSYKTTRNITEHPCLVLIIPSKGVCVLNCGLAVR